MFSEKIFTLQGRRVYQRYEALTGFRARISPSRVNRCTDSEPAPAKSFETCQFCPERVFNETPVFEDGMRIAVGESVTFPNLYPFAEKHVVTVITREHSPLKFTEKQVRDALKAQYLALAKCKGYPSINWNNLTSSGASMVHPHMQGISDSSPTYVTETYLKKSIEYIEKTNGNYWDKVRECEKNSERYLFGDSIIWSASPVPMGEKEVRGYMDISSISEFPECINEVASGIIKITDFYRSFGHYAYNMAIRFDKDNSDGSFQAFVSLIARINPCSFGSSDSAFMERLHFEPVVMTVPEDLGEYYRNEFSGKV
ncbi:galactose-1-phosphate uridylyltransferase [Methanomicrobium sp. W14]|uniref:galactose-1-phosphate uridylyltransferase n=1 Tax=Methanomicrobium sp. W14 TaxID=2817839 RepID=UPI001AE2A26D|nr:galactose-1-phosphate uridylyltransferase [Methanomicrobium sp. W14]MBP2133176.1 galactose-1-phosphate uridylyltransferase [Methanomicrobium sp. W14]